MIFNSVAYALFFPIIAILYLSLPKRAGNLCLLIAGYLFYMTAVPYHALLLLAVSLTAYFSAVLMDKKNQKKDRKGILIIALIVELGLLFFFKYFGFACETAGIKNSLDIVLPVGISFYVFQATGYIIDVYRGDFKAEKNPVKALLFTSFFPSLLSGPICRAGDLIPQFEAEHKFDYERVKRGLFRMGWGLFMKLVIAARLGIMVDYIYDNFEAATGWQLLIGTVAYAFQIYCDFASYSELAIGSAECMGFTLKENFRQPFFAVSCADLWRRWHMSLMSWFKDYLYIPLGGSRKGKIRQVINNLIVFTVSGLWHGAAFGYIIWGFLSGVFSVFGNFTKGLREGLMEKFPLKGGVFHSIHTAARMLITFICFNAALIFFKSPSIEVALEVAGKIFTGLSFSDIVSTSFFELGLGTINFLWLLVALAILLAVDIIKEKGRDVYTVVTSKPAFIRWGVYYALLIMIIFSTNIGAASFIYFKF